MPRSRKEPLPFHASAAGKALLANWDESAARNFLGSGRAVSLTHNTITDQPSLAAELDRVRQLGYAVDDQEHGVGIRCVAAPIFGSDGRVRASISIGQHRSNAPRPHFRARAHVASGCAACLTLDWRFDRSLIPRGSLQRAILQAAIPTVSTLWKVGQRASGIVGKENYPVWHLSRPMRDRSLMQLHF